MPGNPSAKPSKAVKKAVKKAIKTRVKEVHKRASTDPQTKGSVIAAPVTFSIGRYKPVFKPSPGPNGSLRLRVVDYYRQMTIGDTLTRGTPISTLAFSPAQLNDTKVSTIASMYERYLVKKLNFHYAPAVPTSVGGALIMGFDKDPTDVVYSGEAGIRHLMGLSAVCQFSPWEHASLEVKDENKQTFYYCNANHSSSPTTGGDERLNYMGQFTMIVMTKGDLQNGTQLGDLWIETELEFYDPTWEPLQCLAQATNDNPAGTAFVNATNYGFEDLRITSVGSSIINNLANWGQINLGNVGVLTECLYVQPGQVYSIADIISNIAGGGSITNELLTIFPIGIGGGNLPIPNTVTDFFNTTVAPTHVVTATDGFSGYWDGLHLPNTVEVQDNGNRYLVPVVLWVIVSTLVGTTGTYERRSVLMQLLGLSGDLFLPAVNGRPWIVGKKVVGTQTDSKAIAIDRSAPIVSRAAGKTSQFSLVSVSDGKGETTGIHEKGNCLCDCPKCAHTINP